MKRTRPYITSVVLLCVGMLILMLASGMHITPAFGSFFAPADSTLKGPRIIISDINHDLGKVEQHADIQDSVMISNSGTDTLNIISTTASCGCTVPKPEKDKLAPGQKTTLKITFHPQGKAEGPFTKTITITSNSVIEPVKQMIIHGEIFISKLAHKEMMHITGVFEGDCANCHVAKGKGELGAKLYEADCAICHGPKADNKPGPELATDDMMNHTPAQWTKIIADGIGNTNMPAFHTSKKGPLSDMEIESLVEYLGAFKKNMAREHSMKASSVGGGTSIHK